MASRAPHTTDPQTFHAFREGSEAAFTAIYHEFYNRVYYFARRYVTEADAQDVAAEAFFSLWNSRGELENLRHVSSFLFVATRNRCLTLKMRQQMLDRRTVELQQLMQESPADFSLEEVRSELVTLIRGQLAQLPEKTRMVFILSFQEGLKPAQIAEQLGVSVKTVKNQKLTAVKLLRDALADHPLECLFIALLQLEQIGRA